MNQRKSVFTALLLAVFLAAASFNPGLSAGFTHAAGEDMEVTGGSVRGPDRLAEEGCGNRAVLYRRRCI